MSSNQEIKKHIESSKDLVKEMGDLRRDLQKSLRDGYEELMGEKPPVASLCKVFQSDTTFEYTSRLSVDHFLGSAQTLLQAGLAGDDFAGLVLKAMDVAKVALQNIFGDDGLSMEIKGDSALCEHDGEDFLTAMYSVKQVCTSKQWFTESDFTVAEFLFFVAKPTPSSNSALALPGLLGSSRLPKIRRL